MGCRGMRARVWVDSLLDLVLFLRFLRGRLDRAEGGRRTCVLDDGSTCKSNEHGGMMEGGMAWRVGAENVFAAQANTYYHVLSVYISKHFPCITHAFSMYLSMHVQCMLYALCMRPCIFCVFVNVFSCVAARMLRGCTHP